MEHGGVLLSGEEGTAGPDPGFFLRGGQYIGVIHSRGRMYDAPLGGVVPRKLNLLLELKSNVFLAD